MKSPCKPDLNTMQVSCSLSSFKLNFNLLFSSFFEGGHPNIPCEQRLLCFVLRKIFSASRESK